MNTEQILSLVPKISGFVRKHYDYSLGHTYEDQEDYIQEGVLAAIEALASAEKIKIEDEQCAYLATCAYNHIRDYALQQKCPFKISVFKLRRFLEYFSMSDIVHEIEEDFRHKMKMISSELDMDYEEAIQEGRRQRMLNLLDNLPKKRAVQRGSNNRIDWKKVPIAGKQELLMKFLNEYNAYEP